MAIICTVELRGGCLTVLPWACRVIKEGGLACMIGPVHPTFWLSRFFADAWMLFPTEEEYTQVDSLPSFVAAERLGTKSAKKSGHTLKSHLYTF